MTFLEMWAAFYVMCGTIFVVSWLYESRRK